MKEVLEQIAKALNLRNVSEPISVHTSCPYSCEGIISGFTVRIYGRMSGNGKDGFKPFWEIQINENWCSNFNQETLNPQDIINYVRAAVSDLKPFDGKPLNNKERRLLKAIEDFVIAYRGLCNRWADCEGRNDLPLYETINTTSGENWPFKMEGDLTDMLPKVEQWEKAIFAALPRIDRYKYFHKI